MVEYIKQASYNQALKDVADVLDKSEMCLTENCPQRRHNCVSCTENWLKQQVKTRKGDNDGPRIACGNDTLCI